MEYNSNNILKTEYIHFFTYLRINCKKDGKVTFALKRKPYG